MGNRDYIAKGVVLLGCGIFETVQIFGADLPATAQPTDGIATFQFLTNGWIDRRNPDEPARQPIPNPDNPRPTTGISIG